MWVRIAAMWNVGTVIGPLGSITFLAAPPLFSKWVEQANRRDKMRKASVKLSLFRHPVLSTQYNKLTCYEPLLIGTYNSIVVKWEIICSPHRRNFPKVLFWQTDHFSPEIVLKQEWHIESTNYTHNYISFQTQCKATQKPAHKYLIAPEVTCNGVGSAKIQRRSIN